jgi:hypothetical protein
MTVVLMIFSRRDVEMSSTAFSTPTRVAASARIKFLIPSGARVSNSAPRANKVSNTSPRATGALGIDPKSSLPGPTALLSEMM